MEKEERMFPNNDRVNVVEFPFKIDDIEIVDGQLFVMGEGCIAILTPPKTITDGIKNYTCWEEGHV
jgi:hypothetical protein